MGCDEVTRPGGGLLRPVLPICFRSEAAWPTFSFSLAFRVEFLTEMIDHEFLFPFRLPRRYPALPIHRLSAQDSSGRFFRLRLT